jgi:hypothetical protein
MSALWQKLADLIAEGTVRISEHGYDALADDGLAIDELGSGGRRAVAGLIADELVNARAALAGRVQLTLRGRLLADAVVRRLLDET